METLKEIGFVAAGSLIIGWIAVLILSVRDAMAGRPVANPLAEGRGHHFPGSKRWAWWQCVLLSPVFVAFAAVFGFLTVIFVPPQYLVWRLFQRRASEPEEPIQPLETTRGK